MMEDKQFEKLQDEKIKLMKGQNKTLKNIELNLRETNVRLETVQTNTNHMGDKLTELGSEIKTLSNTIEAQKESTVNILEIMKKILKWILYITLVSILITGGIAGYQLSLPPNPFG